MYVLVDLLDCFTCFVCVLIVGFVCVLAVLLVLDFYFIGVPTHYLGFWFGLLVVCSVFVCGRCFLGLVWVLFFCLFG